MQQHPWWQTGIIYQIYPLSFQDSNGDGYGDLPGIISRLDYLSSLGVDALWLSPVNRSPMHDHGYDVSDYLDIDPLFGTLSDMDQLLDQAHRRGLKVIMDLVPNHTSDQHAWFRQSRASRDNPLRDWYIWRDPAPGGGPPNNWLSYFGGPAWTFDEHSGQYYLHQFDAHQPELNYRHPQVLPAMLDIMRFWLGRGADGFRVDVLPLLLKDPQFRDEPPNPDWDGVNPFDSLIHCFDRDLDEVHSIVRSMRRVVDEFEDRVMIGEIYLPIDRLVRYYGPDLDECHLPFNFHLILNPWTAPDVRRIVEQYEAALPEGGWPNWVNGNHDRPRTATRAGPHQARLANMLLLTLRGTPTVYYGEELGMESVEVPEGAAQDPISLKQPDKTHTLGRDQSRTPMQWDSTSHAGFTRARQGGWLPAAPDFRRRNVALQESRPDSDLHFFRALTALRRQEPSLNRGEFASVRTPFDSEVFAYSRAAAGFDRFQILLNFGSQSREVGLDGSIAKARLELSTQMDRQGESVSRSLKLRPDEGVVLRMEAVRL